MKKLWFGVPKTIKKPPFFVHFSTSARGWSPPLDLGAGAQTKMNAPWRFGETWNGSAKEMHQMDIQMGPWDR